MSAQKANQMKFSCPGMRSILPASFGSQKLWITSSVRRFRRTALLAGKTSSLAVTIPYWGYSKTQKNLFPVTLTVMASSTADFSKLSFLPVIPVVKTDYKFQPILVSDVAGAIMKSIETKNNEGKIYEIGGPKIISFGDMVKSILSTINKKRFIIDMPMPLAKIQSSILSLLPFSPILTRDQCEILSETDNVVSSNYLTLKDLNIKPVDVETEMKKWLWRFRDGGEFAKN